MLEHDEFPKYMILHTDSSIEPLFLTRNLKEDLWYAWLSRVVIDRRGRWWKFFSIELLKHASVIGTGKTKRHAALAAAKEVKGILYSADPETIPKKLPKNET